VTFSGNTEQVPLTWLVHIYMDRGNTQTNCKGSRI